MRYLGLLVLAAPLLALACRDELPSLPDASTPPVDAASDVGVDADADAGTDAAPLPVRTMLVGTIVTPDSVIDGEVLVEGDTIVCVGAAAACDSDPHATGATVVQTNGVIAPGLIDTHNHILFDIFDNDDWLPSTLSTNHDQWTTEPRYGAMLDVKQCLSNDPQGKPTWCANTPYGTAQGSLRCEMDKWGELKALIAGTTSVVGLPGTSSACFGSLARSVDVSQNGLGQDKVRTSATFPPSTSTADSVCANFANGTVDAFLVHCGEGTDAKSLGEFAKLGSVSTTPNCLYAPQTTITHGVAFGATEFQTMQASGMKLTWSPASNVTLYGTTTNIPAALDAGVTIALAPDWSMGGSQNLLDEMRFANTWDDAHFANRLAAKDLVMMTTANAASVLGLSSRIGQIKPGYLADLIVVSGATATPYDTILAATPGEMRLVMVGGVALYGDVDLQGLAPASPGCEAFVACGKNKFLCVATSATTDKLNQTYAQIQSALEAGLQAADQQTTSDGWNFAPLTPLVKCP
ncbi:MAG TPA: amidohydrolase family protein [Polyangiaceae bacterium]|nr:amidohydrolase family protein [Polyangiaceae bacterium]